jgi:putative hemolysin
MDISSALWWFFLNILSMIMLAFYSMEEMACVSLNKVRLHYYVSKGIKRAVWLNYLLQDPARLFGTTLFCVNLAMMVGSEFARQSYEALGLSPDLAPLTQVVLVVIFAELAPMFAARRYPEHVAMLGAPILYFSAKLITPLLWSLGWISKLINWLVGGREAEPHIVLNREDLQRILSEQEEEESEGEDFNTLTWNIFSLRNKDASQVMQPIHETPTMPSNATVAQLRELLKKRKTDYILLFHRSLSHIVGIVIPRDLLRISDTQRVRDHAISPWFITRHTKVPQILREFRHNKKSAAIVINEQGAAIGVITLGDLLEEIFGEFRQEANQDVTKTLSLPYIIDRTFPADKTVGEFNRQFSVVLDENGDQTLAELMEKVLGHPPMEDETIYIPPFELTVVESSLMEIKKIAIKTRIK